jgi:hypothetical protein
MNLSPETVDVTLATIATVWNLYCLPALLVALSADLLIRGRAYLEPGEPSPRAWVIDRSVVQRIGMLHYLLSLWSLTTIASELWSARLMGGLPLSPALFSSILALAVDLPLGLGLRRFWRGARWSAVVVAALRSAVAAWVTSFQQQYGAALDLTEWPRLVVSRALPFFVLTVLLLPSTARVFWTRGASTSETSPPRPGGIAVALVSRVFVVLLSSVVFTDALDWALRAAVALAGGGD